MQCSCHVFDNGVAIYLLIAPMYMYLNGSVTQHTTTERERESKQSMHLRHKEVIYMFIITMNTINKTAPNYKMQEILNGIGKISIFKD